MMLLGALDCIFTSYLLHIIPDVEDLTFSLHDAGGVAGSGLFGAQFNIVFEIWGNGIFHH